MKKINLLLLTMTLVIFLVACNMRDKSAYIYEVGDNLEPGEYLVTATIASGSAIKIIDNDKATSNIPFRGNLYVTLNDYEKFELNGADIVQSDSTIKLMPVDSKYKDGMYKIGVDIAPGEYKIVSDGSNKSFVEVRKSSLLTEESIVFSGRFTKERLITLRSNQYVRIEHGYITNK